MDKSIVNMINLYIINQTSRAAIYGIGTYISELTASLKDSNVNIYVVHLRSNKPEKKPEEIGSIQHFHIPAPINRNTLLDWGQQNDLYYRNVVYLLQLQIKNTDRLIFHLNYNHSDRLAESLKKAFDCKIVTVVHYSNWGFSFYDNLQRLRSILNEEHLDSFGENLKKSVEGEKLFYSSVDHIICLSGYMYEILCRDYQIDPARITVIPNGLADVADAIVDKRLLRKKWNVPLRDKLILFAGRMDTVKGLEYLLKAFRDVLQAYPRCRLVIAGDGVYNKYTKESQDICTRIAYTGLLDKAQLYEWYRLADVGVVPSLFEPFGYVAVEMMMHELPIVATATSGLNEVVDDTCGLKVPIIEHPESVEIDTSLLAQKILYLLQHPAEARKMGKNGRKRYLKEYSSEVFRRNMLELYESLYQPTDGLRANHERIKDFLKKRYPYIIDQYLEAEATGNRSFIEETSPIWICWWQGKENMSDIVKICIHSICSNAGSHPVKLITRDNYMEYVELPGFILEKVHNGMITLTHLSDILRFNLLYQYGGYWMDATVLLTGTLWKEKGIDFFTVQTASNLRYVTGGKWAIYLIGGGRQCLLFDLVMTFLHEYWKRENIQADYFLTDHMIALAYDHIPAIREMIDRNNCYMPAIYDMANMLNEPFDTAKFEEMCRDTRFHKLSWKRSYMPLTEKGEQTFYGYLLDRFKTDMVRIALHHENDTIINLL